MPVGTIVDMPNAISAYARVRSEHGHEYTVRADELDPSMKEGDTMAYRVDVWQYPDRDATTLRRDEYGTAQK